ncbi:hypothetical protein [Natranaeroarchaeum sulfidigenes]|uniref:Putative membrane protein n=1 Tax=Natranaeroarchaeum sulfidigenes TaxID=2784880 RepID=A0A897MUG8_9EURY|nr:hypothetical protein [Natranaeroarchaeum sulfidigenes]QSG03941.1 putative membrane protein [Natranaeroarchaeum sulfidigenes]
MSVLNSFGALVSGLIAAAVMLVFAILSVFVTVFIVDAAAAIGGLSPSDDYVVLGATLIASAAIVAGGAGFATPEDDT